MREPLAIVAAATGIALWIAAIAGCQSPDERPAGPAVPTAEDDATLGVATRYRCTFHWTGSAEAVECWMSPDGQQWDRIADGIAVERGSNTIWILIGSERIATATAPRIRIGTADRRIGFETAIKLRD